MTKISEMTPKERREHFARIGALGGKRTYEKHGKRHMSNLGKRGLAGLVRNHWNGDRDACLRRLHELGLMTGDPYPSNGAWQFPQREGEPY